MTRPRVLHDGFILPNAGEVTNPRMAEPDQIDYNTLSHGLWGVVEGCLVTVTGSTATVTSGVAIVNGALVTVPGGSVTLASGGSDDRFDLVGVNPAGSVTLVPGIPALDPYFPDPPLDFTMLAAVFAPGGKADFSSNVLDKRRFISKSLLTKIAPGAELIRNVNGTGNHYLVDGAGKTVWEGDTALYRDGPETLRVVKNLHTEGRLDVNDSVYAANDIVADDGVVQGRNLQRGTNPGRPDSANGDLFQGSDGRLYAFANGAWNELATVSGTVPVGTLLPSIETPANMIPKGWIPLNGMTVTETQYPRLFNLAALAPYVSGTAPNRTMAMPDASNRMLMADFTKAATLGGTNTVVLKISNLPRHRHNTRMNAVGGYTPTVTLEPDGQHDHLCDGDGLHEHPLFDPGHGHYGADFFDNPAKIIAVVWGGTNKIDALFNDRNHTYSVEALDWVSRSGTGVLCEYQTGPHGHVIHGNGRHIHKTTVTPAPNHAHVLSEDEVGLNEPLTLNPSHITCYLYVRS